MITVKDQQLLATLTVRKYFRYMNSKNGKHKVWAENKKSQNYNTWKTEGNNKVYVDLTLVNSDGSFVILVLRLWITQIRARVSVSSNYS
jgi:hypothetical protein